MKISLIIPAYNEEKYLPACLESVFKNRNESIGEVIVVDNGSTDGTAEVARKFTGVKVVSEPRKGLSWARQRGLLTAQGELLGYIDADCRMPAGWCEVVVKQFKKNPKLVCLSGMYKYYDLPALSGMVIGFLWRVFGGITYLFTSYMVIGGNFVVRKTAMEAVGGFDTNIAFYGEDTDIARRLHTVGKVRFMFGFFIYTSARRWYTEGFFRTCYVYVMNYVWEAIFGRPYSMAYNDIR